mgnify:CR=1 FL=1
MKRKWIALVLSVSVLAGTAAVPAFASEIQQEISEMPAVETLQDHTLAETDSVEENCVLVGLKGSYLASADAALKRINEIRKEACKQGVQDPRDPNRELTMSDYVPVKWSSDLEYIARVRAAEASVYMDHQRPNGTMCFSQASPNGVKSWGEVLAWNNSNDMITGIDQWYGEKQDWVKQTGGVTGHYTSMINPNNLYVGLATFICPDADFKNTTSGEFSFETGLDEGQAKAVKNKVQKIQVQNQDVKAYMEPFKEKLASSKTQDLFFAAYLAVRQNQITGFPAQLHFMIDHILNALKNDSQLLIFVSKNLSWNVFQAALEQKMPDRDVRFYDKYLQLIEEGHQAYEHPDLLLFSVIELASSTCYNCILYQQPVPLEEYMPYLHKSIDGILSSYQKDSSDTSAD